MQKLKRILVFVTVGLIIPSTCYAEWTVTYGGSDDDGAHSIQQTSDGGYVVAGYTNSFGAGGEDVWVLKLNSDGTTAWQKTYGEAGMDRAYCIQQTSNGGYILAGSYTFGPGYSDAWVLKLNSDGTIAWQKIYEGGNYGYECFRSIQQTSDDGYIAAGSTGFFGAGKADFWVLKLNSDGTTAWQKTYGGSDWDYGRSIQQTFDGGYILAGGTRSFGAGDYDVWVLKLNSDGTTAWQKTYGESSGEWSHSVQQTFDGGYILAGGTDSFGAGLSDVWVVKLNSDGTVTWQKRLACTRVNGDYGYSIQQTSDGGYIVAGETDSFAWQGGVWIIKLDADGNITWQKTYGEGYRGDGANSIQQTTDGGYVVAGYTRSFGVGGEDVWVLKLNENGEIPFCGTMDVSDATTSDTSAVIEGTSGVSGASLAVSVDTTASSQDTSADTSYVCAYTPIFDASGTWISSTTNNWVNPGNAGCPPQQDETSTSDVTQTGNTVTAVDDQGITWTGTVRGVDYTISTSYPQHGGTATVIAHFTLSSSKSGSGTIAWDWTDGTYWCNGGSDLTLTKFPVCCAKPTLEIPSGAEPTYQWSCGDGEWSWFWVYVLNLYTGAYYGSGWVNSSDSSWASPFTLPWGNYRVWVRVYHPLCGYSEWSDPQNFAVGDCCAKQTQMGPSGSDAPETPTYEWSCSGAWDYYWVYVVNTSTGAYYGSGWQQSGDSSWTSAYILPWGTYQWWVRVFDWDCGYSEWSGPMDFTLGDCCAKPQLSAVDTTGTDPVISWSCDTAEWQYAYVHLQNLSTGVVVTSGWLNGTQQVSQWTATGLPGGCYRLWVILYHHQCGYSEWSDPVDFIWGSCCCKPTLEIPSGGQPRYQWSCDNGEWTWFWVYVQNLSTGAYYGTKSASYGWVNNSNNYWDSIYTLPAGSYRAWVRVYHESCGLSEWSDPQDWTVGSP